MELLKIARYYSNSSVSKEKRREFLKKVSVHYCIPDTLPGKQQIQEWAGYTSLHFAVQSCDFDLTVDLLNQGLVKQGTKDRCTPLHKSSNSYFSYGRMREWLPLINTLLTKQVETNKILNPKCKDGISHFHIACIVNHVNAVEFFAKAKVPLDQPIDVKRFKGYTPLHCAIEYSSVKAAEVLLQYGADMHMKNSEGKSCLHLLVERILNKNDLGTMEYNSLRLLYKEAVEGLLSIIKFVLKANDEVFVDDTGLSALHVACTLGDKSIVGDCLRKGADVNKPINSGSKFWPAWTPLHFAACVSIEIILLLMESGGNITMKNLEGETPLDLCAKRFTPADIQLILSNEDELKDIVLTDNCMKLLDFFEAIKDLDKLGDFLLNIENANIAIPLHSPVWPGYNLLHLSVSLKERTKYILYPQDFEVTETKEPTERYNCTEDEMTLFIERIELCLWYGCSVDMTNANGQTPIHLAFKMKSAPSLEKLLSSSQVNVVDQDGLSHLHIACALKNLDAVKRYLNNGAAVNSRVRTNFNWEPSPDQKAIDVKSNSTPLHVAVLFDHQEIIQCLLEKGANVYAKDSLGRTPIHSSMTFVSRRLANLLFATTPNLRDSVSSDGLSHLHVAAWAKNQKAVEDLLRNGAKIDRVAGADVESRYPWAVRSAGDTALLVALNNKAEHTFESFWNAGANVYKIVESLLKAGAPTCT